ncbi:MAG: TRAP transporter small permease, partial [Paracoccus sp.]|nr:TRAP transporter small permease [Paracoccus sp. (in: a-proteobacteria)]
MSSAPSGPPAESGILNSAPVRFVRLVSEISLAAIVAAYAIIICTQVFYRYALNSSLVWSEEVVRFALLWGVMIGAGVATDRLAHIALDPLANT